MVVNIYYGGRGLIEDPTLYVLNKIEGVLDELRVTVNRFNLYEIKSSIPTLPQTIKEADAIILASSVEWYGIGGYMQEFLDACWLYGDKEKIKSVYMCPVVISTTYGEKGAINNLCCAWELLGGILCDGICAYVEDSVEFEMNRDYADIIEKKAEDLYRTISQKRISLPSSSYAIKNNIMKEVLDLTPQETEQLSKYASDDVYVKQQKEDIEELTKLFKGMLNQNETHEDEYIKLFQNAFVGQQDFYATYSFVVEGINRNIYVEINGTNLVCRFDNSTDVDVLARLSEEVMNHILKGRYTFQRAFMTGEMTAKGNFKVLRMLDSVFQFS
jgi:multimeric flavodoxin WrbA